MLLAILVGVLFVGYGTAYVASEDVRFLTRAGFEENRILRARQPIDRVVADPNTDPDLRAALGLVLEVRDYADTVGLAPKETYTTYADVERDTLLLVLSAAPKNCLCPYTWRYPIVGRVPYKGFFDFDMARQSASDLAGKGFDTSLRPSAAFSTLGWFNDPLLSTAVSRDSVELAALVFHEITHNTIYVPSAAPFNEGLAQMVGYLTTAQFFDEQGDSLLAQRARGRWQDEIALSAYYDRLTLKLDSLYGTEPPPDSVALRTGRTQVGEWAGEFLADTVGPRLSTYRIESRAPRAINNAHIVARRIYRTNLSLFDAWYVANGRDVAQAIRALEPVLDGVTGDSAYVALERALSAIQD
jgi:predicted aminopeptidase